MPQRNFPYAYSELQRSLKEINTHFTRTKVSSVQPLTTMISKTTPTELVTCLKNIDTSLKAIPSSAPIVEIQVTGLLCERFKEDVTSFIEDLQHEIDTHSVGLMGYLSGE